MYVQQATCAMEKKLKLYLCVAANCICAFGKKHIVTIKPSLRNSETVYFHSQNNKKNIRILQSNRYT